jgi:hypothetical protein
MRAFERNVMTVSEYEERFRASAPSLHETFTEMRGPSRGRWRRRRLWTAAGGRDIVRPAGGRGHDRAVSGARHGGGLRPRQQDYRTASGAVIAQDYYIGARPQRRREDHDGARGDGAGAADERPCAAGRGRDRRLGAASHGAPGSPMCPRAGSSSRSDRGRGHPGRRAPAGKSLAARAPVRAVPCASGASPSNLPLASAARRRATNPSQSAISIARSILAS